MFDMDHFIEDCLTAVRQDPTHKAVSDIMARAIERPEGIIAAVGEPTRGGLHPIYCSPELTVLNIVWSPCMTIMPHNHEMWANIGIYTGREDNIFWRKIADDPEGRIEAAGAKSLAAGQFAPLGKDVVHSVTNPLDKHTAAIHVYGGDFFAAHRSEWEPDGLTEQPYDVEHVKARFRC